MYRFVKIASYYRDFLKQYYAVNQDIINLNYAMQYRHLMDQAYSWSDFYSKHLSNLGVEAYEIVFNAEHLQQAWARENNFKGTLTEILIEQLRTLKPDVVFFQDSIRFNSDWINSLRQKVPTIKQIIGFCCSPFSNEHIEGFRCFDYLIVCSPQFYNAFTKHGIKSYIIYHAFEPSLLTIIQNNNFYPERNLIFTGSLVPGSDFHSTRKQILQQLIDSNIEIDLYANIISITPIELLFRRLAYLSSKFLKVIGANKLAQQLPLIKKAYTLNEMPVRFKEIKKIQRIAKPPIFGIDMLKALSRSRICFNIHGEVAGEYAANIRLFEATGVGSCLLTDWKKNLNELFDPDNEVVSYKTKEECLEKLQWLLDHPEECKSIGKRGQERTLRNHTFQVRANELNEIILSHFK